MTMLNGCQVLQHLIDRKLIDPHCCLNENIRVTGASRRHNNFSVTGVPRGDFFVKQGRYAIDVGSIANEFRAYKAIESCNGSGDLHRYIPTLHDYDEERGILALEAIPNGRDLEQYHTATRRFPITIAKHIGAALGHLHETSKSEGFRNSCERPLKKVLPTVFNLRHPPMDILKTASGVWIELTKLLQRHPRYIQELETLAADWKTESLIHGDIKLSNFVICRKRPASSIAGVKLVDWEFAGLGDTRWDVGSVFNGYLALWIYSVPITRQDRPDELLNYALFPLERIQPGLRAFWVAYCAVRGLSGDRARDCLHHSIRLAATCLIQTAYEYAKNSNYLTAEIITMMQVSLNMFISPQQAARHLLGIEEG